MKWIRFTFTLLLLTLLNVHWMMDYISFGSHHIQPDLLLIFLVYVSINGNAYDTLIAAFAIGFAADISGSTMGPSTLIFVLCAGAISFIRQVVIMKRAIHQGLAVFATGLLAGFFIQILTLIKTGQCVAGAYKVIPGTALYSAIAAPFLWVIFSIISGWLGIRNTNSRMRARA